MSEQEHNIEFIKRGYEAFNAGDGNAVMDLFDDNIEWVQPGDSAIGGSYRGKQDLAGLLAKMAEKQTTADPQRFIADGDDVIALCQTTAGGETSEMAQVFTLRDGKVVAAHAYADTAALERIFGKKEVATA